MGITLVCPIHGNLQAANMTTPGVCQVNHILQLIYHNYIITLKSGGLMCRNVRKLNRWQTVLQGLYPHDADVILSN